MLFMAGLHPEKCPSNHQKLRWKYGNLLRTNLQQTEKTVSIATFQQYVIKKSAFQQNKI
jgi:hypothetical protein